MEAYELDRTIAEARALMGRAEERAAANPEIEVTQANLAAMRRLKRLIETRRLALEHHAHFTVSEIAERHRPRRPLVVRGALVTGAAAMGWLGLAGWRAFPW